MRGHSERDTMESDQQSQTQTQCGAPQAHGPHWWEEGNHTDSCPGNQQSQTQKRLRCPGCGRLITLMNQYRTNDRCMVCTPQQPYGGVGKPTPKRPSWGDTMRVTKRIHIEPAIIPQVSMGRMGDTHGRHVDDYITGELLHERHGRGNLHNWDASTGERLPNLHPFAGANVKPPHGATQYLKLDAPRRSDTQFID